jgi:hypothetical protein
LRKLPDLFTRTRGQSDSVFAANPKLQVVGYSQNSRAKWVADDRVLFRKSCFFLFVSVFYRSGCLKN